MTETGDRELIIGNKQLISLFFVVVALCGVFFAMGYMIGRNSTKTALAADAGAGSTVAGGQRPQAEPRETASQPDPSAPSAAEQTPPQSFDSKPAIETRPAQDTSTPIRPEPQLQEPQPQETQSQGTQVKPARAVSGAATVSAPEAGASYLQVTALPRPDADGVVKTLREQSFPTILATSSKDGLFRVLVGPYHQTTQLAEAKARLKAIGFGSAFVQKQ